jgi:hypothetical protein
MQGRDCIEWDAIGWRAEDGRQRDLNSEGGNCWNAECGKKRKAKHRIQRDNLRSGGELEILITSIYFINIKTNHNLKSGQTYR